MGAGLSAAAAAAGGGGLGELPESCVAVIVARLDPPEICRMAGLNRAFRRAAAADVVWAAKLPENYGVVARKLIGEASERMRKIEIYARLCSPLRFDGGSKEVWLDKKSGKMCMAISWKSLKITGIHDRRYWTQISSDESRFHTIAYLQQIWWLEASGDLEFNFPQGSYSLFFRLQIGRTTRGILGRRHCSLEQVHGWDVKPIRFKLSTPHGQNVSSQLYLDRAGSWICYHVGDFTVKDSDSMTKIKFSMTQIDCTHTKGGLCLDSVLIYPAELKDRLKEIGSIVA